MDGCYLESKSEHWAEKTGVVLPAAAAVLILDFRAHLRTGLSVTSEDELFRESE
jgi:hypothetical protein